MDKEEILERARKEKNDEGIKYVKNKGLNLGYTVFLTLIIILLALNIIAGRESEVMICLLFGFFAAESYSTYQFSKRKIDLCFVVGASFVCFLSLVTHILHIF